MPRFTLSITLAAALVGSSFAAEAAERTVHLDPERPTFDSEPPDLQHSKRVNSAPCGDATIAVVHADAGDTYAFCALDEGVAMIEVLSRGDQAASLIDRYRSPLALFEAVLPKGTVVPRPVTEAIAQARRIGSDTKRTAPFTVGQAPPFAGATPTAKVACPAPSNSTNGFNVWDEFFGSSVYCGLVDTGSASSNDSDYHYLWASETFDGSGNEGSPSHAGPHYDYGDGVITYFADEDEDGGARFGRALVRSCSGVTRFRGWLKASPTTGSWGNPVAEYYVPQGALYVMRLYANPSHSLWMGYDADDIAFHMEAVGNATFGSRMYFAKYGWGTQCDINY